MKAKRRILNTTLHFYPSIRVVHRRCSEQQASSILVNECWLIICRIVTAGCITTPSPIILHHSSHIQLTAAAAELRGLGWLIDVHVVVVGGANRLRWTTTTFDGWMLPLPCCCSFHVLLSFFIVSQSVLCCVSS